MEFIVESLVIYANELNDVNESVQKVMEKIFEYLKVLHTKSYVTSNGKLVDIERMQAKFIAFVEEATDPSNF